MTHAPAIRTTLMTSFTLLLCNSIVCAQDGIPTVVENGSVVVSESESIATSTNVILVEEVVDETNLAKKQTGSEVAQARPGERVSNPDHLILNFDTTLGGGEVRGTGPNDYGYMGPGDMRTHLWNGHSKELIENGITEYKLMAMAVPEVQKWHNHFHGVEGSPEHPHDDEEQGHLKTIVQQSPSATYYVDDQVHGTSAYENSGYLQSVYGQPEIIYEQGVIIQGTTAAGFEFQMQPTILNQGLIQSWTSDR